MQNNLEELEKEIRKLRAEKHKLTGLKEAKLQLLKEKVESILPRLEADHPVLAFLASHGYGISKATAKEAAKAAKDTGKAAKETGEVLFKGAKALAYYTAEKKLEQYRREGRFREAQVLEERLRRAKKRMRA